MFSLFEYETGENYLLGMFRQRKAEKWNFSKWRIFWPLTTAWNFTLNSGAGSTRRKLVACF